MVLGTADPVLVRAVGLFVPLLALVAGLAVQSKREASGGQVYPGRRDRVIAALIVGGAWNALGLGALNWVAIRLGWWRFDVEGAVWAGIPVDLWLGWTLLWGALPVLWAHRFPLSVSVIGLAWLDLVLMPLGHPTVTLGSAWLVGEAIGILLCLLPGLVVIRWTLTGTALTGRIAVQVVLAGVLAVGLPAVAVRGAIAELPGWMAALGLQAVAVALLVGLAAVREFATRGFGTPLPYDPPVRLVTSGPYAYVGNPMQISIAFGLVLTGVLARDVRLIGAASIAFAYSAGLAGWQEHAQLSRRFGSSWATYRAAVRPWWPRWRPFADMPRATVFVATSCPTCSGLGRWIVGRAPVALEVRPADSHPRGLRRFTYESTDGYRAEGIRAVGAMLTHLNLGWAAVGWFLVLPGVRWFAQTFTDALIG